MSMARKSHTLRTRAGWLQLAQEWLMMAQDGDDAHTDFDAAAERHGARRDDSSSAH
jgi:hypothetical protein